MYFHVTHMLLCDPFASASAASYRLAVLVGVAAALIGPLGLGA